MDKYVDEYFDFDEIAKHALGTRWYEQPPPEKQQEFTRDFRWAALSPSGSEMAVLWILPTPHGPIKIQAFLLEAQLGSR